MYRRRHYRRSRRYTPYYARRRGRAGRLRGRRIRIGYRM